MNKKIKVFVLITFLVVTLFSCKKVDEPKNPKISDADVNYNGSLADPSASFTPFQIPSGGITGFPSSFDLTQFMPPVRNQNSQGSCVGFCLAYLKSYQERLEYGYEYTGNDKIMSPAFIYNQIKSYGDCSAGTQTIGALNFLKQSGISTEAEFPYNKNNCSDQPSQSVKNNAIKNKIREWEGFIFKNNNDVIDEMKFAISQMQPIIIDFKVDAEFAAYDIFTWGTIIWKQNNSGDPTINGVKTTGFHCALIIGYDDSKNAFKLINSWGTSWKNDGYCWVDYAWLMQRVRYAFVTYDEFHSSIGSLQITGDLNFGNTTINKSSTKVIQLTNNGTTNIDVSSVSISSPFSTNWNNGTIQPGTPQSITITFNPLIVGNASSTLTITSNATNNPVTVEASGVGIQPTSQTKIISLSGNLSYGNVSAGQTVSKTLTISNNGNSPLSVSSISTPQGFSGSYSGTIQAGNSVNVSITFTPTNVQSYSGDIIVNSDATSGTNVRTANGNGVSDEPVVVPAIGTYSSCAAVGSYNCPPSYGLGTINARIVSINTSTHEIVVEIKKCNGTPFNAGGKLNVVNLLCGGPGAESYGFGSFSAGATTFKMTIVDNNMVGSKAYVAFIAQGASLDIYYSAPTIEVTY